MNSLDFIAQKNYENWIKLYKKNTFKSLKEHFDSEQEFNLFFDKLCDKKIQFKFIFCGNYYNYLKFNKGLNANIQLIMLFSIIEKIYSEENFINFKDWCDKEQKKISLNDFSSFKDLLEYLKLQYHKANGSKQKTLGFFDNYFEENDKKTLLNSVIFKPNLNNLSGEKINFAKFVSIIYTMRNNFVHDAKFIPIHKEGNIGGTIYYNGKEVFIHFDLPMNEFLDMFEKAFLKYWGYLINKDKNAKTFF